MVEEFKLEDGDYIELSKLLKITGLCNSGGMAKGIILQGEVMVDNQVELRRGRKIRKGQKVQWGHKTILVV